ncbi:MAG: FHA domain-containing protein [Coriobacteriia bacterium]|nr:FHA domain-containing protein [Coriobacteriia bacterium]
MIESHKMFQLRAKGFMMGEKALCPVCQYEIDISANSCAHCGFKLVGATQEFSSPGTGGFAFNETAVCGKPHLTVTKGPIAGQVFYLEPLPISIGRDPECDLFLNNMTVSRLHAIIEKHGSKLYVRDGGSLNGTWVDGKVVEEADLVEGTLLQIGTFSMRFSCL